MSCLLVPETMISVLFLICFCFSSIHAQQFYDPTECSSEAISPGSRCTCNSTSISSCKTFLVYRANQDFQTILNISTLFQTKPDELLHLNNLTSSSEILKPGREVLVPITCHCLGTYFQANSSYVVPGPTSSPDIACGVFEGLFKSKSLIEENSLQENGLKIGDKVHIPLKCACPDDFYVGVRYLVTYPFVAGDGTDILSKKFGISPEDLWTANHCETNPTVFAGTTFLVPLKGDPVIDFSILDSPPPSPNFLPTAIIEKTRKNSKLKNLFISVSVVGFFVVFVVLLVCGLYVKALRKWKREKMLSFNGKSSPLSCSTPRSSQRSINSCLSPDILAGIKFSLHNYSMEDVRRATKDFSEDTEIGDEKLFKGSFENVEVLIRVMNFGDTRRVINLYSKINHKNIVNLHGVCYGQNDFSWSYLMFELPGNGCLKDCLSNQSNPLDWKARIRIAFDIATGLNYLHNCIFPSVVHLNINCRNIFLTADWRAKLGNIGPNRSASDKVDIFAFGVVMLELISGKEVVDGKQFKDSIGFLGGGVSEGGCFEQLRMFIDPSLENYHLAEALCLAVLAKACVEDEPLHRPSMDDVMKVLGRII